MFVGVLRIKVAIPGARTLKDRRAVVLSLRDKLVHALRASVADISAGEHPQHAALALTLVSASRDRVEELMGVAVATAGRHKDALLTDEAREVLSFGAEGASMASTFVGEKVGQVHED